MSGGCTNKSICRAVALILAAPLFAGCASIVSDDDSTTYFETDPEKARCVLHGQDFRRVVETPTSMSLPSEAAPITVACKADGYRETAEVLDTSMDGWILGNIIFGGVVGAVVDAARGAGQKFSPRFMIVLEPSTFSTGAERDDWYDRRRRLVVEWARVISQAETQCSDDTVDDACEDRVKELRVKRDAEPKQLEDHRGRAQVN